MVTKLRGITLAMGIVLVAVPVSPTFATCGELDSGQARPQYMLDRLPECGGTATSPSTPSGGGALTTLFAADNQGSATGGAYFDLEVVGPDDVEITGWDTNLDATFNGDVSVWYRVGTFAGAETSSAGWVLVGTATGIVSAGNDLPTSLSVGTLSMPAGTTYGIALSLTPTAGTVGHHYTNGTGGNEIYNDGVLELRAGSANNVAFSSGVFSPRVWNGTVYYDVLTRTSVLEIPSLGGTGLLVLFLVLAGVALAFFRRQRQAH